MSIQTGYSDVNGLRMYYEIHAPTAPHPVPLVLIHGGGSTIETTFGRVLPLLGETRRVIALELQAHGRTSDREGPLSFEQDANDVAKLLENLGVAQADVLGFSNGGNTALWLARTRPKLVRKLVAASAMYERSGAPEVFWEWMQTGTLDQMPQPLKNAYRAAGNDEAALQNMFNKCAARMTGFADWPKEYLTGISTPTLLIGGDADVMTVEHLTEMYRLIPNCQLSIFPGGHGAYLGEITTLAPSRAYHDYFVPVVAQFLE